MGSEREGRGATIGDAVVDHTEGLSKEMIQERQTVALKLTAFPCRLGMAIATTTRRHDALRIGGNSSPSDISFESTNIPSLIKLRGVFNAVLYGTVVPFIVNAYFVGQRSRRAHGRFAQNAG